MDVGWRIPLPEPNVFIDSLCSAVHFEAAGIATADD